MRGEAKSKRVTRANDRTSGQFCNRDALLGCGLDAETVVAALPRWTVVDVGSIGGQTGGSTGSRNVQLPSTRRPDFTSVAQTSARCSVPLSASGTVIEM